MHTFENQHCANADADADRHQYEGFLSRCDHSFTNENAKHVKRLAVVLKYLFLRS